jgi:hypothetical protein
MKPSPDELAHLTLATTDEIIQSLSFALQFRGRKRVHDAGDFMARVAAERLVQHLQASGFVVMKKPSTYDDTGHIPRVPLKD